MFNNHSVYVFDVECKYSADDCRHCGAQESQHLAAKACMAWGEFRPLETVTQFEPLGWKNKSALGLSIGCAFSYDEQRIIWFDEHTLADIM